MSPCPAKPWRSRTHARRGACLLLALALLALAAPPAISQTEATRSVLLFPVRSHWVSAPLAEAVTRALLDALVRDGLAVSDMQPGTPIFQRGRAEGWLQPADLEGDRVQQVRHQLAVAAGAQTSLAAELREGPSEVALRAELAGAVSRQVVPLQVSAPIPAEREALARALAEQVAAKLTVEVWAQAGADAEGQRAAAAERYAAGQQALAAGMYLAAGIEFDAAVAGEPNNPDYLRADAEGLLARGNAAQALVLLQRLANLRPDDRETMLVSGDAALLAGDPDRAEFMFMKALDAEPSSTRALEGVARAARARGDLARSESYYADLLARMGLYRVAGPVAAYPAPITGRAAPGEAIAYEGGLNSSLPGLLARQADDSVRLTTVPLDAVNLQIGRVYLIRGYYPEGVRALLAYQTGPDRPPYADAEYLALAARLDEEGEQVARRVAALSARPVGQLRADSNDETGDELEELHQRSDRLATLSERMQVSPRLDPAHRYRVLAYNLLNQSGFEALLYYRTHDEDRGRRAEMWRRAFREAREQALQLSQGVAGVPR